MIHIVFRENGVAVNNAEEAEKIANALVTAGYNGAVLSYVEFNNPNDMLVFFKLLKLLQMFGDPTVLEEKISSMKREYDDVNALLTKTLQKKINIEVNGNLSEVTLRTLLEGIDVYGYNVKLEISEEKIKISFNRK